jgi:hypothetical protein
VGVGLAWGVQGVGCGMCGVEGGRGVGREKWQQRALRGAIRGVQGVGCGM